MDEWIPLTPTSEWPAEGVEWKMRVFYRCCVEPSERRPVTFLYETGNLASWSTLENFRVAGEFLLDAPPVNKGTWWVTVGGEGDVMWRRESDDTQHMHMASPIVQFLYHPPAMNDFVMK